MPHPVTPTERTFQYRHLRYQAKHIRCAEDKQAAAKALLKGLALLVSRKVSGRHP